MHVFASQSAWLLFPRLVITFSEQNLYIEVFGDFAVVLCLIFLRLLDFYKIFNLADVLKRFTPAVVYHDVHMYFYAKLFGRGDDLFG